MKYIFILIICLSLISCKEKKQTLKDKQDEIETGSLDSTHQYKADEIGWTTRIPGGWEVLTKEATKNNTERGKKEIEKTLNVEVDASGLQQLLNLKKDRFNSFLSTIEPYDEATNGLYEENNKKLYTVMKETYAAQGIKASYSEDSAIIDGLYFYVFKAELYKPASKEVLLNQIMYSRLINGYDFGMTLSYNDEDALIQLENMVFTSKFSKRDKPLPVNAER